MINGLQADFSWNSGDAFDTGYDLGYAGGEWLSDKVGGIGDSISNMLGTDYDNLFNGSEALNPSSANDLLGDIGNISDNTDNISDKMDLTSEDLEYLRKIAALEWKKEFTTANITVDMKNYNTVEGDGNLDGIVTKLVDKLYEELDSVANGVYS